MNFYHIIPVKQYYSHLLFFYTQINFIRFVKYALNCKNFKINFMKCKVNVWFNVERNLNNTYIVQFFNKNVISVTPIYVSPEQYVVAKQSVLKGGLKNINLNKSIKKITFYNNNTLNYTKYLELVTLNFNINRSISTYLFEKTQVNITPRVLLLFFQYLNSNYLFNFTSKFFFIFRLQLSVLRNFNQLIWFDLRRKSTNQKKLLNMNFKFV